ncbi:MAG: class C sortase [Oscillospiraceae bacterium]|nr:class C sortase [Oscillospiraceae bacterium]
MKKHLSTILIMILLLVGLSVLLYPAISAYINSKHASRVVANYQDTVDNADEKRIAELRTAAEDYNRSLMADPDAFFFPDRLSGYRNTLDITGTGIMGNIAIDRIKVELPLYHGTDESVLQVGAGHIEGTSLPVGGAGTHCVLSGHRGLPSARLFTDLDQLEVGDTFTLNVLDEVLTYQIDQIRIVLPTEYSDLLPVPGEDLCTLVTCTPYGINTHRLLVRGKRIETVQQKPGIRVQNEAFQIDPLIVTPIASVPMLLVVLIAAGFRPPRRKKHDDEK